MLTSRVEQAIESISSRIGYTRTGREGAAVVDAEGGFGVRYRRRTSRALDPQLNDHVLVSNAVCTVSDGEWRTLDARGLYRKAKAAGVEFEEVDANGQADIVGFDQELLEEFSTRGVDIEASLGERSRSPHDLGSLTKSVCRRRRCALGGADEPTRSLTWIVSWIVCSHTLSHLG